MKHFIVLLIVATVLMIASFYLLFRTDSLYDTFAPVFVIIFCSVLIIGKEGIDLYVRNFASIKVRKFFNKYGIRGTQWSWGDIRDGYFGTVLGLIAGWGIIIAIELIIGG